MGIRRRARVAAVTVMYQREVRKEPLADLLAEYIEETGLPDNSAEYARRIVEGVGENKAGIETAISTASKRWRTERMAAIDRNIIRCAVYELMFEPKVPPRVVMDEAIELAKKFGDADSGKFVNGVLDSVAKTVGAAKTQPKPAAK